MEETGNITVAPTKRSPSDFLKQVLGKLFHFPFHYLLGRPVVVKLNTGEDYRGDFSPLLAFSDIFLSSVRCIGLSRWLYEYCYGTN